MHLSEYNFPFDSSLIATEPVLPREQARLLVLQLSDHSLTHRHIIDLPDMLTPGDLLVVNDTRVRPARVIGRKRPLGKIVDVLFVKSIDDRHWEVLLKGTWCPGQTLELDGETSLTVLSRHAGRTVVRIEGTVSMSEFFHRYGRMPLPPYIKRQPTDQDRDWYQTVFAKDEGAIAAPTAGLHFTPALLARFAARHIELAKVTLHVGIGTFKPVTADHIEAHRMDAEWIDVGMETVQAIERTKQAGRKIVAVGTTVVRALESAARQQEQLEPYHGETSLFITPGFDFHVVDALLTNFHLPQTTLLMLVSAFAGRGFLRQAYEEAVRMRYRFYSYGDAMFITSRESSGRAAQSISR
jgi:S-adenosylmethionine:tRNA ribosyltransferase-isomerase